MHKIGYKPYRVSALDFFSSPYVLSTFVYEPVRWIERFGWRSLSLREKQALFQFWRSVGQQMNIQNIPTSYTAFEDYNLTYESKNFRYSPASQRVGESTLNLFLSWFPPPLRLTIQPFVYAIMDEPMLQAFGFPSPRPWQRRLLEQLLKTRGQLLHYWPPRQSPSFYSEEPQRGYPAGYDLNDLGPPKLLPELNHRPEA
ncbi:MAG: oxygenase MpaB family protein [Cyanobacteria bacterium P01_D01_bin.14]